MKAFMSKQFRTLLRKNPELVRPNVDPDAHRGALDVLLHEKEELRKPGNDPKEQSRRLAVEQAIRNQ